MAKATLSSLQARAKPWRELLKIHPAAELFPLMTGDERAALAADIASNGVKSSIDVFDDMVLDGRNRLDAMQDAGFLFVPGSGVYSWPDVYDATGEEADGALGEMWFDVTGSIVDPYEHVVSRNILRRHLNSEQKRDLVARLLKATPDRSNRDTATLAKVSHPTVAAVRQKLEERGEIPKVTETVGHDGRIRTATPKRLAVTPTTASDIAAGNIEVETSGALYDFSTPQSVAASLDKFLACYGTADTQEFFRQGIRRLIPNGGILLPDGVKQALPDNLLSLPLEEVARLAPGCVISCVPEPDPAPQPAARAKTRASKPPETPPWCKPGALKLRAAMLLQAIEAAGSKGLHEFDDISPLDLSKAAEDRAFDALFELRDTVIEIDKRVYLPRFVSPELWATVRVPAEPPEQEPEPQPAPEPQPEPVPDEPPLTPAQSQGLSMMVTAARAADPAASVAQVSAKLGVSQARVMAHWL